MTKKQQLISIRGTYIAPECNTLEIKSQGLVCQSLDIDSITTIPSWDDGADFPMIF